jgi:outer membrane protein TolC
MSSNRGQWPRKTVSPFIVLRLAAWMLAASLLSAEAIAQQDIPLTLAAAEDLAIEAEPGREAMLAQANAFDEESVAAAQRPELKLRMALANYPIESGGFTTEGMTQAQLGLRVEFPPGGVLDANARQFGSRANEMRESANARSRDVLASVRHAWLETYYWQRTHAIVNEARPFFVDLLTVTRSLYSVGRRNQQDLLRAELELSRLDDRLIEINNQHTRAIASLSEWIGRDANRPLAEKLPDWTTVPSLPAMQSDLREHPAVMAANARIDTREARIDAAEEDHKSGWMWELGYGYRDGRLPDGTSRSDFVSLSVTMDLPFGRDDRQGRHLAAAFSERRAAEASKDELLRRLSSRLDAEYSQWSELSRRIDLYEQQILSQAGDNARASLVAYQSDAADFANVMRAYIDDLDTRVEYTRLVVERAKSFAALANLGGFPR